MLIFVSGNKIKIAEATESADKYGVKFEAKKIEIAEIQNSDALEVSIAKAHEAFAQVKKPLFVHDSSWSIPAVNGFPGAYMHDVANWFSSEDWLKLMAGRSDRSIKLIQTIVYFDGETKKVFRDESIGEFIEKSRGEDGNSIDKTVTFSSDGKTLAEVHDESGPVVRDKNQKVWMDFFEWYSIIKEAK